METSNSTVTGSETFSTGLMNWLYLLNSFLNSRSSALDEKQSVQWTETLRREGTWRVISGWMSERKKLKEVKEVF